MSSEDIEKCNQDIKKPKAVYNNNTPTKQPQYSMCNYSLPVYYNYPAFPIGWNPYYQYSYQP